MASIQERLQRKREPLDKWSTREQLCLAFAVVRSGDQNWMSVSRAMKPFGDPNRPADWFHQKNCAAQYGALLENVETPKRKKRATGVDAGIETASESILRRLIAERKDELKKVMAEEKAEYAKLQKEMALLKSGTLTEEQLDAMCKQIDEEEAQKENETAIHGQWLREREMRKQEIERQWRPAIKVNCPSPANIGQKRKASDCIDSLMDSLDQAEGGLIPAQPPEPSKPALSPLLTSLLKSPSHAQNVVTSSILHSAITSQRPINSNINPTIASLLNSSAAVQVSAGIQQLVSTAISQEPSIITTNINNALDLLDHTDTLPNLKVEDIAILSSDEPLPEIKNEEVDVIISDLIENADIVTDPEQHLLDGNDDLITDFENELEELVNEEKAAIAAAAAAAAAKNAEELKNSMKEQEKLKEIDPFEFQEDPEIFHPTKPTKTNKPLTPVQAEIMKDNRIFEITKELSNPIMIAEKEIKREIIDESFPIVKPSSEPLPGSVEIVEVVMMEDEQISKELNKSEIQNIVHSMKPDMMPEIVRIENLDMIKQEIDEECVNNAPEMKIEISDIIKDLPKSPNEVQIAPRKELEMRSPDESPDVEEIQIDDSNSSDDNILDLDQESKSESINEPETDEQPPSRRNTFTPEFGDPDMFDDMNIEVTKLDKKAKRDYSRTKKKDETDFDILLAVEQAVNANLEEETESLSEKEDKTNSLALKPKIKIENERSNSPWTEEEEISNVRARRRYSTPATPTDSIPNSPASSTFDEERDYRNWKKSVMLVYSQLATHKYASLFHRPITNEHAPGYHNVVKRPMDLQTLRRNVESGVIRTTAEFQRDVLLMLTNAIMYNKTNDTVYRMATEMQEEGVEQIRILLQVEADAPQRRETRTSEGSSIKRKRNDDSFSINNARAKKRKEDSLF